MAAHYENWQVFVNISWNQNNLLPPARQLLTADEFKDDKEEITIWMALQNAGFQLSHVLCLLAMSVTVLALYAAQTEAVNLLGPELLCE